MLFKALVKKNFSKSFHWSCVYPPGSHPPPKQRTYKLLSSRFFSFPVSFRSYQVLFLGDRFWHYFFSILFLALFLVSFFQLRSITRPIIIVRVRVRARYTRVRSCICMHVRVRVYVYVYVYARREREY